MIIKEMAAEERPRERLIRFGSGSLSNAELLAVLVGSGTKDMSAVDLGNMILSECGGGLRSIADLTAEELIRIDGVGEAKACRIIAGLELAKRIASLKTYRRRKGRIAR